MESIAKYTYEEKVLTGYVATYECSDAQQVQADLMHELISKKINCCRWIKSIKRVPLYNGQQKIIVTYEKGRRIYIVSDN